jgi:hypothetical protein
MVMTTMVEIPKKKPNFFYILDKKKNQYNEIKYLSQNELADGWNQLMPHKYNDKLINNFSVTLAFLPEYFWSKLKKIKSGNEESYKVIIDGITKYTIIETNQDTIMIDLFNEIRLNNPNIDLLKKYINELDTSQHSSWLVLRSKYYIIHNKKYNEYFIKDIF